EKHCLDCSRVRPGPDRIRVSPRSAGASRLRRLHLIAWTVLSSGPLLAGSVRLLPLFWSAAVLCAAAFVFGVLVLFLSHVQEKQEKSRKAKAAEQSTAALQKRQTSSAGEVRKKNRSRQ